MIPSGSGSVEKVLLSLSIDALTRQGQHLPTPNVIEPSTFMSDARTEKDLP